MQLTALILTAALGALPAAQQAAEEQPPPIDLMAAVELAAAELVAEDLGLVLQERDPETGRFVAAQDDTGTGYFGMLANGTYDPAVLAFFASSAVKMYSAHDLRNQCNASEIVTCAHPFPGTVNQDIAITAGVYAGVTALQRLAKTQWDVDLDEGWKQVLLWGGMAAVRGLIAAQNMSDANALRELGR